MSWKPNYSKSQSDSNVLIANDTLENRVGINTLRGLVDGGWTLFNYKNGSADEFTDQLGIDTVNSIGINYDNVNFNYSGGTLTDLLILSETTNGSTTFIDSSPISNVITPTGNTQHSTAKAKFGLSSMLFDGAGDALSIPNSTNFDLGSGDFTFDYFINYTAIPLGAHNPIIKWGSTGNKSWQIQTDGNNGLLFAWSLDGTTVSTVEAPFNTVIAGVWQHHAIVRNGATITVYIDGVSQVSATIGTGSIFNGTSNIGIGGNTALSNGYVNGYIEYMRFVKGIATWTANFTPPVIAPIAAGDFTLISNSITAISQPTSSRVLILHEPIDTVILNTDIILSYSRDGGTTYSQATLVNDGVFSSGINILSSGNIDLSTQPTGTSMKYKIITNNLKQQRVHGTWQQWG